MAREKFSSWKVADEHAIFRDFIELERNSILKEYELSITEGPIPIVAHLQRGDGFDVIRQFLIEEKLYRPISGGVYDGEDGRTLIDDAIQWWRVQLGEIDDALDPDRK